MKEKILLYLSALTFREKLLLFATILLLGAFFGVKTSQALLESFFDYDLSALYAQKRQVEESNALYITTQRQKSELDELNKLIVHFNADEKGYLNELYSLANAANINFTSIKNSASKDTKFAKHSIFIEFESTFEQCLAFLNAVQHSPFFFEFKEIKLNKNEEAKSIQSSLHLRFAVIK